MRGEQLPGGGQQVFALAGALGGQHRVAAGDQPVRGGSDESEADKQRAPGDARCGHDARFADMGAVEWPDRQQG